MAGTGGNITTRDSPRILRTGEEQSIVNVQRNKHRYESNTHSQRLEEPLIFPASVPLLEQLFDVLLRVLPLANFSEGIRGADTLQSFQFNSISCWEEMSVVDNLRNQAKTNSSRA